MKVKISTEELFEQWEFIEPFMKKGQMSLISKGRTCTLVAEEAIFLKVLKSIAHELQVTFEELVFIGMFFS